MAPRTVRPINKMMKTVPVTGADFCDGNFTNGFSWCCSLAKDGQTWYEVHLKIKSHGHQKLDLKCFSDNT